MQTPQLSSWRVGRFLSLIRFSHTLFALPWALAGLFLGARGWPSWGHLGWVVSAMVGARTAAMAWNRLVDRRLDASNPRTAQRPSVTGEVSVPLMGVMVLGFSALFVLSAWQLNPLCGWLSLPTLGVLLGYSLCKRFTSFSHYVLGVALGLSPLGAYLAVRGSFDFGALAAACLGCAVLFWTAGFDILYACQDLDHDRSEGLHSLPSRLGIAKALVVARISHGVVPLFLLFGAGWGGLGMIYLSGVAVVTALLIYEHRLVRAEDLSRVGKAFLQVNIAISLVMMVAVLGDLLLALGS